MVQQINRRKVLKSVGAGALLSAGASPVSGRSDGAKYSGLAYNPVTHEILGEASAQLNGAHDDLRGNLRVGDYQVNMNKATKFDHVGKGARASRSGEANFAETKHQINNKVKSKDKNEGLPESVRLTAVDDRLTGYVKRDQRKVAYTLVPQQVQDTELKNILKETRLMGGE